MNNKIRVLYIDDYELDRELVKDALEREHGGFHLIEASTKEEFIEAVKAQKFDAVLSDFNIAGFEGLEVIETIRVYNPNIPVIIVTGTGSEEIAVKAIQRGASDYVIKRPNHIQRLPQTILATIEKSRLKEEHELADIRIKESEQRLRDLIQLIPAALIVYNADGKIIDCNSEACRLLDMTPEQLRGDSASDPTWSMIEENGTVLPSVENPINQAFLRSCSVRNRVVGLCSSDQKDTAWLMINAVPEWDSNGKILNVLVTFFDITERKQAQEALRISEERLKLAQEASNDGLWDWNLQTGDVYFNPRYYTMLGYEPYELPSCYETWSKLLHPDDKTRVEGKILEHLKKNSSSFRYEFRLREKSGNWRWLLGKGQVFERDGDGNALRAIGTHTDIDHLKKIQAELHESNEKYWSILNGVELGIALISPELDVIEVNSRVKQWYPNLLNNSMKCYQMICDGSRMEPCNACPIVRTFVDGCVHEEIIETKLNDKAVSLRIISSPIHDAHGNVVAAIKMMEDITEKRRLETQSRQSQKMESLGTLAGGIAHDFNNILSAIIGFSELSLEEAEKTSNLHDNLSEILSAGQRAKELVRRILTFTRQTEQILQPIQVDTAIQESLSLMKSVLPSTIEMQENFNADSSIVMSDPTQFHQIIVNLCTNAGHAMEDKGGVLEISLRNATFNESIRQKYPDSKAGKYLRLSVRDSGKGIPPDDLEKIFDPYFTTKKEGKGSGLGLSVVHGLVRMHDGWITVQSKVGKGTIFHIFLPLAEQQNIDAPQIKNVPLPLGTERILLVDDEPAILKVQSQNLNLLGYSVITSSSSVNALEIFRSSPDSFDLIITDMTMPKITGDELALSMKKIRPQIPIILSTGYSPRVSDAKTHQLPIDGFLLKPVARDKLAILVRKILDKTR